MKIKNGFLLNEMGDEFVVVAATENAQKIFSGMIRLNSTGALIWNKLQEETTIDEIADLLCNEYGIDKAQATEDCDEFLNTFREVKILDE